MINECEVSVSQNPYFNVFSKVQITLSVFSSLGFQLVIKEPIIFRGKATADSSLAP